MGGGRGDGGERIYFANMNFFVAKLFPSTVMREFGVDSQNSGWPAWPREGSIIFKNDDDDD